MGKNVNYYYYYYGIINIITRSPGAHSGRRMIWCDSALQRLFFSSVMQLLDFKVMYF